MKLKIEAPILIFFTHIAFNTKQAEECAFIDRNVVVQTALHDTFIHRSWRTRGKIVTIHKKTVVFVLSFVAFLKLL